MSEWPDITVAYVTPGGVLTRNYADGAATMRICLGHVYHPDDGLLVEMDDFQQPVPWESAATKAEAIGSVETRADFADSQKAELIKHIKSTSHYE